VPAHDAMLDAHVQFEMTRLTGDGLDETVHTEVEALFDWFAGVRLDDLASPEAVTDAALVWVDTVSGPQASAIVVDALVSLKETFAASGETVEDVVSEADAVRGATALAGMDDARGELIDQLTTSKAYSRLVAHVVYQGVKSYLLKENVLAKRIPGASSLVRLGQRGLGAAAPGLEQNVDRQLIAFVDSNIADTIKDSRRFIDSMMNQETIATMTAEGWAVAADRPVASLATVLTDDEIATLVDLVAQQWSSLRDTALVRRVVAESVEAFFARQGARPLADVLADVGVSADVVVESALPVARSAVQHALDTGYLQTRVRTRLAAFYDTYEG
jgi:hypothetical protein